MPRKFSERTRNRSSNVQQNFGDQKDPFFDLAMRFAENQEILNQFMMMEQQAPGLFDELNSPSGAPVNALYPQPMAQHSNPFSLPLTLDLNTFKSIPMTPWEQGGAMPQFGSHVATLREGKKPQRSLTARKGDKPKKRKK